MSPHGRPVAETPSRPDGDVVLDRPRVPTPGLDRPRRSGGQSAVNGSYVIRSRAVPATSIRDTVDRTICGDPDTSTS